MSIIGNIKKRGLYVMASLFFSVLFQNSFLTCHSQQLENFPKDINLIFAKNHIGFTITPLFIERAIITRNIDHYSIHSTPLIGLEAGFTDYIHLDKKHSIIIGLLFNAFPRNLNYSIPGNELNPPTNYDITINGLASREFNLAGSIPVFFEKRWFLKNHNFFNIDVGATLRYTPTVYDTFEDFSEFNYKYFKMAFVSNPKNKLWLNYNFGAGYSLLLKNNSILKANLIANISFTSFAKGNYQFTLPNQPIVEGRYEVKGSFVGLSLNYIFTNANYRIRKAYEKMKQNK